MHEESKLPCVALSCWNEFLLPTDTGIYSKYMISVRNRYMSSGGMWFSSNQASENYLLSSSQVGTGMLNLFQDDGSIRIVYYYVKQSKSCIEVLSRMKAIEKMTSYCESTVNMHNSTEILTPALPRPAGARGTVRSVARPAQF